MRNMLMAAVAVASLSAFAPAMAPRATSWSPGAAVLSKGGENPSTNTTSDVTRYGNATVQLARGGDYDNPSDSGGNYNTGANANSGR
jgi:hypothetical protein